MSGIGLPAPVSSVNGMTGDVIIVADSSPTIGDAVIGAVGDKYLGTDATGDLVEIDKTTGYNSNPDYEKTGTYVYVGYERASDGYWFIYRRTIATNSRQEATGTSSYATNWTGRAGLTYA